LPLSAKTTGGRWLDGCIQCGSCSGSCPLAAEMDFGPRGLFALIRAEELEPALRSTTIWLCVSCQSCTVRCPQQIPVPDLMYALKHLALEHGFTPRSAKMPDLYRAFAAQARSRGRVKEGMIAARYGLRHPGDMLSKLPLAIELLKRRRMTF
jgi:heterodisulfide reductase subunit C